MAEAAANLHACNALLSSNSSKGIRLPFPGVLCECQGREKQGNRESERR
jgi:hypothetical protein